MGEEGGVGGLGVGHGGGEVFQDEGFGCGRGFGGCWVGEVGQQEEGQEGRQEGIARDGRYCIYLVSWQKYDLGIRELENKKAC